MRKTIAHVDGKAVHSYKRKGCLCGGDCRDIYTDKTTGTKYIINIDNGEIVVEEYVEESGSNSGGGSESGSGSDSDSDVVGTAVVGQAHAH